jgi:uncharacterized protein
MNIRDLVFSADLTGIESALRENPALAKVEISLKDNPATAHPLHRICDGVFNNYYPDEVGLQIARLFIKYGSDVNSNDSPGKDSPLTAACSLQADKLALFYIDQGADIHHQGCHGGTALHWSAWCGRDIVLKKLLEMNPKINQLCIDFKSTPLFWALHGYKFGGKENLHNQINCARLLLAHGADPSIPNFEGYRPTQLIESQDQELNELFRGS